MDSRDPGQEICTQQTVRVQRVNYIILIVNKWNNYDYKHYSHWGKYNNKKKQVVNSKSRYDRTKRLDFGMQSLCAVSWLISSSLLCFSCFSRVLSSLLQVSCSQRTLAPPWYTYVMSAFVYSWDSLFLISVLNQEILTELCIYSHLLGHIYRNQSTWHFYLINGEGKNHTSLYGTEWK